MNLNFKKFFILFIFILESQEEVKIDREYIERPVLYKNEICSYNGRPIIINSNTIECECYDSYVDEPREKYQRYIFNQKVHCSYEKKKRFKAFFYAGLPPMGLDYYYLGHIKNFVLIFCGFVITIISYIVCFFLSYKLKKLEEESKYNKYSDNEDGKTNKLSFLSNPVKLEKFLKILYIIKRVLAIIYIIYWIVDIITQARGLVKDINGIETENDMNYLFSREDL